MAESQATVIIFTGQGVGAEQLTIDATSGGVGFTAGELTDTVRRAICRVETAQIRIQTASGITITAGGTEGSPIKDVGDEFIISGKTDLTNFKAIRTGGVSGLLQVIFET